MTLLLMQMSAVLLTALLLGGIARKLGQPRVIGEIVGGILLGPSLFGRIAPEAFARFFPQGSLGAFEVLSTVGLILFVFLIGSQLDLEHLSRQKKPAALASAMSILLPCILASTVAPSLRIRFAPQGVGSLAFLLFLGVSMSITAFPVLARILEERGMLSTRLGTTALLCAAVDDVGAWVMLAFGLTLVPHSEQAMGLAYRLLFLVLYLFGTLGILLPFSRRYAERVCRQGSMDLSLENLAMVVAGVLASAAATQAMGVHPLFGAFVAGICFPRVPRWQSTVRACFDTAVSVLLLPFFFVLTGMRTRLDLLSDGRIVESALFWPKLKWKSTVAFRLPLAGGIVSTRQQGTVLFTGILFLVSTTVVIQLWLLSVSMEALLDGTIRTLVPAAAASTILLCVNAGLLLYVFRFDRQIRKRSRRNG